MDSSDEGDFKISDETLCIMDNIQDLIAFHEPKTGNYIKVSSSFYKVTQYSKDDLIGACPYDFFHPDDVSKITESHKRVLDGSNPAVTYRYRRKDGSYLWFETVSQMGGDYLITTTRDVTEREKLEEDNQILAGKMQFLIENSTDLIFFKNTDSDFCNKCSKSVYDVLGYTENELYEINMYSLCPTSLNKLQDGDNQFIKKNGEYVEINTKTYIFNNEKIIVGRDVTERHKLEEENTRLADTVKMILEKSEDLIGIHKFDPNILDSKTGLPKLPMWKMSQSCRDVYGYIDEETANPFELIHPDDVSSTLISVKQAFKSCISDAVIVKMKSVIGEYVTVSVSFLCAKETFVCVARQIDKVLELAKIEKNLAVEKMERKKDLEAAQIFSHEAKNAFLTVNALSLLMREYISNSINYEMVKKLTELNNEVKVRCEKGVSLCMNETMWRSLLHGIYSVSNETVCIGRWLSSFEGELCKVNIPSELYENFITTDKALSETIINNALSNSYKYGNRKSRSAIIVTANESRTKMYVIIRNRAGGNHEELLRMKGAGYDFDTFFDKNMRLRENDTNNKVSSGHGLWVSRLAANEMNSNVYISVKEDTFNFVLILRSKIVSSSCKIEMPNVSVAVLDDDPVERMFINQQYSGFKWIDNLYILGKDYEESSNFADFLIENKIDIALIDENLQDDILGSNIMISARRKGYRGLLISRSSMEAMGGISLLGKVSDGFLPKCIQTEEDIISKLHGIIEYNKTNGACEYDAISSLTDDECYNNADTIVLEIFELPEAFKNVAREDVIEIYKTGKIEIMKDLANLAQMIEKSECSFNSPRPWKIVHKIKGMANTLGFLRLFDYTKHLCILKDEFNRDKAEKHLPTLRSVAVEAACFIDGVFGMDEDKSSVSVVRFITGDPVL